MKKKLVNIVGVFFFFFFHYYRVNRLRGSTCLRSFVTKRLIDIVKFGKKFNVFERLLTQSNRTRSLLLFIIEKKKKLSILQANFEHKW